MSEKLKLVKQNKKSMVYENAEYTVKIITPTERFVLRKNDPNNEFWYDENLSDGEVFSAPISILEVVNKCTGKKATKRVYQNNPIADFEADLDKKSQFSDVFRKIDK